MVCSSFGKVLDNFLLVVLRAIPMFEQRHFVKVFCSFDQNITKSS